MTTSTSPTTTTTTTTATATTSAAVSYDASIGTGVDASGFASLPLRAGAQRYFVNGSIGSDSNGCAGAQQPAKPLKTIAAAVTCVQNANGDQILVAEGTSYAERLPTLWAKAGYSLAYPTVIQSYDPADALNEAKYGRATNGRPVLAGDNAGQAFLMGVTGQGYIAVRGFDVNPGNLSGQLIALNEPGDGILFENNLFRYTGLTFILGKAPAAHHWILRNNAIYGGWNSDPNNITAHGVIFDANDSITVEDNVFWHNGWKVNGAGRDSTTDGASIFRHPIYQQATSSAVVRRNLIVDGAADGGSFRGNATISENVFIDNPISIGAGGGNSYNTYAPNGVALDVSYNAVLGAVDVNSSNPRQWGVYSMNGRQGSATHHNLFLRASNPGTNPLFATDAGLPQPSYMDYHDNISYLWTGSGSTKVIGPNNVSLIYATFENNLWDDPTSGSNINVSGHQFPNAYTLSSLCAALGFGSKQAWIDFAIAHPETHPARNARALLFAGYGMN